MSAAVLAVIAGIGYAYATKENESQTHYGELVDSEVKKLVVDSLPNDNPILRKELSLSDKDIVGHLRVGSQVKVKEVLGPVYPAGQSDLTMEVKTDGKIEKYGVWYKLVEPVLVVTEDGNYEQRTGFIAGNFLRKPGQEELPTSR